MNRRLAATIALVFFLSASAALALAPQPQLAGPYVAYLPIAEKPATPTIPPTPIATTTPAPTATPTPLPPTYNACANDPNPGAAPNYPVQIVHIDKFAETVTLRGRSTTPVNLGNWKLCSVTGNQLHASIPGTISISFGQEITIDRQAATAIWNNTSRDDGALYNANGSLVSYYVDPE